MEIRTLKYFLAVAREQNMTEAANVLFVTQPTLSRQMADLEFLRLRRFFNLYATHEFEEHIPSKKELRQVTTPFFARDTRQVTSFAPAKSQHDTDSPHGKWSSDTNISYIRVDKTLCKSSIAKIPGQN